MAKLWGKCDDCGRSFSSASSFVAHECMKPFPEGSSDGLAPRLNAQWADPVVVFVSHDPAKVKAGVDVRYPATNDRPTPEGYERVEIRSDREMGRFEQGHKVLNERRWFDGSGRGFDDHYRNEKMTH